MMGLLAGLLAAGVAWILNTSVAGLGNPRLLLILPAAEEFCKTYAAVWLGGSVWLSHLTFGGVEAGYDLTKGARENVSAAAISILGHAVFGGLTYWGYRLTGSWLTAAAAAAVVHIGWNFLVLRVLAR